MVLHVGAGVRTYYHTINMQPHNTTLQNSGRHIHFDPFRE